MLVLSLPGLDRGSDTDLFLSGSGVWCANCLFQLQQIYQQLLQVKTHKGRQWEEGAGPQRQRRFVAITSTHVHAHMQTEAGELQ